jgi:hypothetical protein
LTSPVRQIVAQTLAEREIDPVGVHNRLQVARLESALLLAAAKVAAGDLRAIDALIRVLDRMDKYQGALAMTARADDDAEIQGMLANLARGARTLQ